MIFAKFLGMSFLRITSGRVLLKLLKSAEVVLISFMWKSILASFAISFIRIRDLILVLHLIVIATGGRK